MNGSPLPDRCATSVVESCPLGATTTLAELARDPHPRLALLRAREPVSWVPRKLARIPYTPNRSHSFGEK
ncbi:hypothetical protein ACF1HJ_09850 [Streptomyces sp. NPDC013978]|uniref:hypothetical protein n=1 Tax=Streptomyces sp. NPDC013978 TaxID=3364869 RepID=UPI0036F76DE0